MLVARLTQTRQTSRVGAAAALWVIPLTAVAFVLRTIAVAGLQRRHPNAADAVNRWWLWAPLVVALPILVVVLVIVTWNVPLLGIGFAIVACLMIYRGFFTASSIGSPFRPRR
jgi:hypothetical protein